MSNLRRQLISLASPTVSAGRVGTTSIVSTSDYSCPYKAFKHHSGSTSKHISLHSAKIKRIISSHFSLPDFQRTTLFSHLVLINFFTMFWRVGALALHSKHDLPSSAALHICGSMGTDDSFFLSYQKVKAQPLKRIHYKSTLALLPYDRISALIKRTTRWLTAIISQFLDQ